MVKVAGSLLLLTIGLAAAAPPAREGAADARLKRSVKRPEQNGWVYVRLEGSPSEIGFQHGYLLSAEIQDAFRVVSRGLVHDSKKNWAFFREASEKVLLPHVEAQYREELQGISDGLKARGVKLDLVDIVALNSWLELSPYYTNWYDKQHKIAGAKRPTPEHCSAFVATGSYTKDGKPVIAHNNWTEYKEGERWNIVFDVTPAQGRRFIMDGMPGLIHSGDDFGLNDSGLAITETTIGYFSSFDPKGVPEFVRARKAMQYATSIQEFAAIMKDGNNGGYANNWLLVDTKTNEIGSLELGLKNVSLQVKSDGYFVGSNFPADPKLIAEETDFPVKDMGITANARHIRWDQLMAENKGAIDVAAAQRFLADHFDTYTKKDEPSERTLCGHIDLSPRGAKPWEPEFGIAGAVQNKAADATMILTMAFTAAMGHSCGIDFRAADHLKQHPEFAWQKDLLKDLPSRPWTRFQAELAR
jgi:hypothetical protein